MSDSSALGGRVPVVAIVGGGASGTLTAVHLLRRIEANGAPVRVILIDRYGRHGLGQAYSTTDEGHLLNACADRMSALADDPGHLLRWAHGHGMDVTGSDFLPRAAYGRYLRDVLDTARRRARPPARLERMTGTVRAVTRVGEHRRLRVELSNGGGVDADAVVLALGNRAPATWPQIGESTGARYIADPWAPGAMARICDGAPVLVVGTGLTMVDVAITVTRTCPDAVVYAVSRHGLLPRPHRCPSPPPAQVSLPGGPLRLTELLRAVRVAAGASGGDWRAVVDGMRPHVPRLWERLGLDDRRRFLDLVARYWEVHRHRIPPATAARVAELQATGRLQVVSGRVVQATNGRDLLTVRLAAGGSIRELRVGWLVNGTGPASDVTLDPFSAGLFAGGLARPDPLRLGLDAVDGAVIDGGGRPSERIFTLGPTLRGTRYETTAIPEIRAQAAALAPRLLEAVTTSVPQPRTVRAVGSDRPRLGSRQSLVAD